MTKKNFFKANCLFAIFCIAGAFNSVYYIDNANLLYGGECATQFVLCLDNALFEAHNPMPSVVGDVSATMSSIIKVLKSAHPALNLSVASVDDARCTRPCTESLDTLHDVWPVSIHVDFRALGSNTLAQTYYGDKNVVHLTGGCLNTTFNDNFCWTTDDAFCDLMTSVPFALLQCLCVSIALWMCLRLAGETCIGLSLIAVFCAGMTEVILFGTVCTCSDLGLVMLHELGHNLCMRHPNTNANSIVGNYYDALSFMNSYILDTTCSTPMDVMSLHSAQNQVPNYAGRSDCIDVVQTSLWRALLFIFCLVLGIFCAGALVQLVCASKNGRFKKPVAPATSA